VISCEKAVIDRFTLWEGTVANQEENDVGTQSKIWRSHSDLR
jgi:hypothetical protein